MALQLFCPSWSIVSLTGPQYRLASLRSSLPRKCQHYRQYPILRVDRRTLTIYRFLERFIMGYIEPSFSLESKLTVVSICSIRTRLRSRDIFEKKKNLPLDNRNNQYRQAYHRDKRQSPDPILDRPPLPLTIVLSFSNDFLNYTLNVIS